MTPVATYRIQLQKNFTFEDLAGIANYLQALNISHLYLSPILKSVSGSMHGYDVTDFFKISEERGGEQGFGRLMEKLSDSKNPLRIILDIVPNHMAASLENPYWKDVLQKGRTSPYWNFFDIHEDKIILPVLEDDPGNLIEAGIIAAADNNGAISYRDKIFPVNEASRDAKSIPELLERQHYKLVKWTEAGNYRRFFHVNELAGLCTEDEGVFNATHEKMFSILDTYKLIDGLRVDHIDGLAKPSDYLRRLSQKSGAIWVEKITARGETLPTEWDICGTTGYEFIDHLNLLLTDSVGFKKIEDYWRTNVDKNWKDFDDCVRQSKNHVMFEYFMPEIERLAKLFEDEGVTKEDAQEFIRMMTSVLPLYRTYGENKETSARIQRTASDAEKTYGDSFSAVSSKALLLLMNYEKILTAWQQFSGPVMAKGLEDRAHYRYTPLAALNEVGCTPIVPESSRDAFFKFLDKRRTLPSTLNASTTHDTKRSEDTRCRLLALSHIPERWIDFFQRASFCNRFHAEGISAATQYFFYQAVIGTWPLDGRIDDVYRERLWLYMQKSAREAGIDTCWTTPDKDYEKKLKAFIYKTLSDDDFLKALNEFMPDVALAGARLSLIAQTIKILSPGIPDIYQGCEVWDFSLVDPDNRRPVDFDFRRRLLEEVRERKTSGRHAFSSWLMKNWKNGAVKLWLTMTLLDIRRKHISPSEISTIIPLDNGYILKGKTSSIVILYRVSSNKPALPSFSSKMTDLLFDEELNNLDNIIDQFPVAIIKLES